MLFLKTLWAHGFKSFAEPTKIDFQNEMTGIVGPNGSGKSNITDAIRWALGEQSQKSLRGKNMDDIVFAGSSNKKALDKAIVKLTFNNQRETFSTLDTDTVEIVRTYDRKKRESEFFINGEKVRLKDIQDVALETGITKSSLAIISQGTITNFTAAKPEERRELFNEAAGVAKYKKRKQEALNKLIKTQDNLNRINDLVLDMERRLPSLEKAAKKAELYKEKYEKLSSIEISVLIKDGKIFKDRILEISSEKEEYDNKINELKKAINLSDSEFKGILDESSNYDFKLSELNERFNVIVNRISDLKIKKQQADNRENVVDKNTSVDDYKANQLKKDYHETKVKIDNEKDKQYSIEQELKSIKERYDFYDEKFSELYADIDQIKREATRIQSQIYFNERNNGNTGGPSQFVINNANKIGGVVGTLISLIIVDKQYEEAISSAAYSSLNSVVMKTTVDTKRAAEFIRKNPVGKVTFLPLDQINPSTFSGLQRSAIEEAPGFVGFANELVNVDAKYQKAVDYALGTIVVVEDYDSGKELARQMNQRINIVTLDGDRFLPKGAVQAGKNRNQQNIFESKNSDNVDDLKAKFDRYNDLEIEKSKELQNLKLEKDKLKEKIDEFNVKKLGSQNYVKQMFEQLTNFNDGYRIITGTNIDGGNNETSDSESIKISKEIARLEAQRDEIQSEITSINSNRSKSADRQKEISAINSAKRDELDAIKKEADALFYEHSELRNKVNMIEARLLDKYDLTLETALVEYEIEEFENEMEIRELIAQLSNELKEIGNVDIDSIEKYAEEKEHYNYYMKEKADIQSAFDDLQAIINDMDAAMEIQFKQVIEDVNKALPESFSKLFGGGTSQLRYTDPEDILNTGIEIDVFPPGKKITNINLLSGGEKSLVALSVLFSILKVRPLPLVVLDEAEAPLDPSNVERFAMYIKDFVTDTQFIVVTHREGTMENMDVLFGVTMEQKGITKIVKIHLVEAKRLIDEE